MGAQCCRENYRVLNPESQKIMRAFTKINKNIEQIFIQVYDIESEFGKEIEINLKFIKLEGLSQLNLNNSLYLCGSNNERSNDHAGSSFIKIDPVKQPANVTFLISTHHCHYYPSMTQIKNEYIIIAGGKSSLKCEIFYLKNCRWKDLPELPEERHRCTLAGDEATNSIYLFGGFNSTSNKIHSSILKLNLKTGLRWETIIILTNHSLLLTKIDACVCRVDKSSILIVGGKTNENEYSDEVIECNFSNKSPMIVKNKNKISLPSRFNNINFAAESGGNYYLIDEDINIHKISVLDNKHSYKSFFNLNDDEE